MIPCWSQHRPGLPHKPLEDHVSIYNWVNAVLASQIGLEENRETAKATSNIIFLHIQSNAILFSQSLWCFGKANSRHDWRRRAVREISAKAEDHQRQFKRWRSNGWQKVSWAGEMWWVGCDASEMFFAQFDQGKRIQRVWCERQTRIYREWAGEYDFVTVEWSEAVNCD